MIPAPLQDMDLLCLRQEEVGRTGTAWTAFADPACLLEIARKFLRERFHLEDISALDAQEGFLVAYFFDHMEQPCRIGLYVLVPHQDPIVPSIAHIYQGADWHEREASDFYGITFTDHPNLIRLLLPGDMEDWPLRKAPEKRAPLRVFFNPSGAKELHKSNGFTLLDEPEQGKSNVSAPARPSSGETTETAS